MKRKFRILRIWYYGRIETAKRIKFNYYKEVCRTICLNKSNSKEIPIIVKDFRLLDVRYTPLPNNSYLITVDNDLISKDNIDYVFSQMRDIMYQKGINAI